MWLILVNILKGGTQGCSHCFKMCVCVCVCCGGVGGGGRMPTVFFCFCFFYLCLICIWLNIEFMIRYLHAILYIALYYLNTENCV